MAGVLTLAVLPRSAWAQSASSNDGVQPQYRLWFNATRPAAELERVVFQAFVGLIRTPDGRSTAFRYSLPGFIFKPKRWIEVWTDSFGVYTANHDEDNSWELRPRTGLKVYAIDAPRLRAFNYTRFEYRFVHQGETTTTTPRIRDRFGIELPFTHARPWMTHTWYGLTDVELFWVLNDGGYFEQYRIRVGTGYILSRAWRAEFMYHAQLTGDPGAPKTLTENIWRLNIKLSLPRRGERVAHPPDSD